MVLPKECFEFKSYHEWSLPGIYSFGFADDQCWFLIFASSIEADAKIISNKNLKKWLIDNRLLNKTMNTWSEELKILFKLTFSGE